MNENKPQQPDGWQRLTCTCGTLRFAKVIYLRWRAGGGVTEEPAGYFCLECQATVDSAALISKAQLKAKQHELKELQDELASGTMSNAKPGSASIHGVAGVVAK